MGHTATEILKEARSLPAEEFDWLIGELLDDNPDSKETEIEAAWKEEVERRVADADAGTGSTHSWEEIETRLRARLSA